MTKKILVLLAAPLTVLTGQESRPPAPGGGRVEVFERRVAGPSGVPGEGVRQMAFGYVNTEDGMPGQVVKGMPYSAQSVNETTQTLADGNRIRHSTTSQVYRDSEGRTRREASLGALAIAPEVQLPQLIFINDPVAGFHYVLNVQERTVQKSKIGPPPPPLNELKEHLQAAQVGAGSHPAVASSSGALVQTFTFSRSASRPEAKTTSLGRQTMEGVEVEGTRTAWTIPAGEIGNERPIEVVTERWYCPALQTVVLSRHNDPRMGETVVRLTNISRSDPPRILFEPPADYKVTEGGAGDIIRMRTRPLPPQPPAK